tara:strand:- start:27 stop:500 length:474 start_codon:yes stop_codon:yes gene_type:complete
MSRIIITLGASAPNFTEKALINGEVDHDFPFSPSDKSFKILFFYTGDFKEENVKLINNFGSVLSNLEELDCKVYGVSVDSIEVHTEFWKQSKFNYDITLFADVSRRISASYSSLSNEGHSVPSIFIIDGKGKIRWYQYSDVEINMNDIVRVVEELKR